jgi:hypothetical protein
MSIPRVKTTMTTTRVAADARAICLPLPFSLSSFLKRVFSFLFGFSLLFVSCVLLPPLYTAHPTLASLIWALWHLALATRFFFLGLLAESGAALAGRGRFLGPNDTIE